MITIEVEEVVLSKVLKIYKFESINTLLSEIASDSLIVISQQEYNKKTLLPLLHQQQLKRKEEDLLKLDYLNLQLQHSIMKNTFPRQELTKFILSCTQFQKD